MITTFYPPYHFGGDAVYLQRLAHALARRGHEVHVIHDRDSFDLLSAGKSAWAEPAAPEGVHVHTLKSRARWLSPLATQQTGRPFFKSRKIRTILDTFPPDVTHFHNISLVGGPAVLNLGRGVKIYSTHEHWLICPMHVLWKFNREPCQTRDCVSCQLRGRRPPQWWRSSELMRRSILQVDLFLSPSQFTVDRHTKWGGLGLPMEVLPYFCESPAGNGPVASCESGATPYFLCVGRLERIKGFHELIPAFARYNDAELRIVGTGESETELRKLASSNSRVRFMGRCSDNELQQLYRGAIATIFPSLCYETFGLVIIESLAHRTPVISNHIGGQNELVNRSGGGLTYSNEDELLEAMRRLQTDSQLRNNLAENGHAYFLEHWTEKAHLDRYLGIVERLLEGSRNK